MRSFVILALATALLLSQSGCSFFAPTVVPIAINCPDPDAELFVDGKPVGKWHVTTMVPRDTNHVIMAKKGEKFGTVTVGTRLSAWGILDIIGGCLWLVPFFGLLGPGSRNPENEEVTVTIP